MTDGDAIVAIAQLPDGKGKHAAFMRCVLGIRDYVDIAYMASVMADEPLSEHAMRYIAAHWQDEP